MFGFLLRPGLRTIDCLMISSLPSLDLRFTLRAMLALARNGGGGSDKLPNCWPQNGTVLISEVIHEMSSGVGMACGTGWALSFTALLFGIRVEAFRICTAS